MISAWIVTAVLSAAGPNLPAMFLVAQTQRGTQRGTSRGTVQGTERGTGAPLSERLQLTVGSKKFTESVILGEVLSLLVRRGGAMVRHQAELGGTRIVFGALEKGEVDVYPEYTGTCFQEIFAGELNGDMAALERALEERGIRMSRPLGFNNTYAIGMLRGRAASMSLNTISQLQRHQELVLGFTSEFMDRGDGWPALRQAYSLPHQNVRGLDHDLAYRGLAAGSIDVIDLYSTDAEIDYYDLKVLEDDRGFFPRYDAVLLYRADLAERAPGVLREILWLEGKIAEPEMVAMNASAKLDGESEAEVAAAFLERELGIRVEVEHESAIRQILRYTKEHLILVGISLTAAILLALPLGVLAAKRPAIGQGVLAVTGIVQTIPSLALFVFMIPLFGIGAPPAIVALFLYSLLPIVRNTHEGLNSIPVPLTESARALGLSPAQQLFKVELPLASRSILAGLKISAVICVGTATLGALIGAGGYGQPILTGIRRDDLAMILQGAVSAAVLALLAQGAFELLERVIVPKGLRIRPESG